MPPVALAGKRWGDVDDDDDDVGEQDGKWDTKPDENGIFMRCNYDPMPGGGMKKTVQKMKLNTVKTWTNRKIQERKTMQKFGKPAASDPAAEKSLVVRSEEDVQVELSKKIAQQVTVKDEAEDKFYEESLTIADNLNVKKAAWTDMNKLKQEERDHAGTERAEEPDKTADPRGEAAPRPGELPRTAGGYVPPSVRNADVKGKGKGNEEQCSLRVTNLAEDCRDGDLQELFGSVGRVSRVYIARDMDTKMSRGFAFVTYYTRADAEKAVKKLDGHPYDNLILKVQFAKPRA